MVSGRVSHRGGGGGGAYLPSGRMIAECGKEGSYKFLGVDQLMAAQPGKVKARVGKEYIRRVRKTWSSNRRRCKCTTSGARRYCVTFWGWCIGRGGTWLASTEPPGR